jgi:hypothetical protein
MTGPRSSLRRLRVSGAMGHTSAAWYLTLPEMQPEAIQVLLSVTDGVLGVAVMVECEMYNSHLSTVER